MRKRKTRDPCQICFMHMERCICAFIPKLQLKTRLCLVIHHRELKRTTNTGRLAIHALANSQMIIRGQDRTRLNLTSILSPEYETYVLQPSEAALDIEDLKPTKPVQLIVSDGNWRQASKLHGRHPEIAHLPRVRISQKNLSMHHLRKEHFGEGFSTLEAIAITMGFLEGESVKESLLRLYQAKLHATVLGRGMAERHNEMCGTNA
ncbi:MAG: tRNA-uridine aminocarboxypropyltransferase [Bdellovibrionota bacterium]